jgi:hypothetical protein
VTETRYPRKIGVEPEYRESKSFTTALSFTPPDRHHGPAPGVIGSMISKARDADPSPVRVPENEEVSINGTDGVVELGSVIRFAPPLTPAIVRLNGFDISTSPAASPPE